MRYQFKEPSDNFFLQKTMTSINLVFTYLCLYF